MGKRGSSSARRYSETDYIVVRKQGLWTIAGLIFAAGMLFGIGVAELLGVIL